MLTFANDPEGENALSSGTKARIVVLDLLIPAGFIVACIIFARGMAVKRFGMFSTVVVLGYVACLAIAALLHVIMTASDSVICQYKIMVGASFALTEAFNMFLVFIYRAGARKFVSTSVR